MKNPKDQIDEVNQLLQAAQDEMLLKLRIDSHTSRSGAGHLNPDLDRRFQALKPKPSVGAAVLPVPVIKPGDGDHSPNDVLGDDLFARFAALKGSPSKSSPEIRPDTKVSYDCRGNADEDVDEVQKIIDWAVDAARLDPSPPSDDDEETDAEDDHPDDDDDDDDDEVEEEDRRKGRRKQ